MMDPSAGYPPYSESSKREHRITNTNNGLLLVAYDYEYDYKTRKVSVRAGEHLNLLQKTNEHWWKVARPGVGKPFFVPAQYVDEVEDHFPHSPLSPTSTGDFDKPTWASRIPSESSHGRLISSSSLPLHDANTKRGSGPSHPHPETAWPMERGESSKNKTKEPSTGGSTSFFSFAKGTGRSSKIGRNEGARASHREKTSKSKKSSPSTSKLKNMSASLEELSKQIIFPGMTSESVADLTFPTSMQERRSRGEEIENKTFLQNNNNRGLALFYARERSSFSSFTCDKNTQSVHSIEKSAINKCLNNSHNPNFQECSNPSLKSPSEEQLDIFRNYNADLKMTGYATEDTSLNVSRMDSDCLVSPCGSGVSIKEPTSPVAPLNSPVRFLADGWAEYYSPESSRYFYYNSRSKITSWKPPRNSSNKKSDDHLGSLSDGSANASSFEKSLDNIPDLVGSPNLSFEAELNADKASNSLSSDNDTSTTTNMVSLKADSAEDRSKSSESIASNSQGTERLDVGSLSGNHSVEDIPVPDGWERQWDETTQQICYVNKVTGARWLTSTDSQGRLYYYEENSSNSSWFLPSRDASTTKTQRNSPPKEPTISGTTLTVLNKEPGVLNDKLLETVKSSVKKRHSAGEAVDRNAKAKSLLIPNDLMRRERELEAKTNSLPRFKNSIWSNGNPVPLREGSIARAKLIENSKKVRKNWGLVYGVITASHLSLFKDTKAFAARKTDLEMDLAGASLEWTSEKSSRKNVFQLSTLSDIQPDQTDIQFQILFQLDDKDLAIEWFEEMKQITDKFDLGDGDEMPLRFRSTESPDSLLDPLFGERKITSRLNRNRSTTLRITPDDKERLKIKDHLRRFFSRRPPRESLVKKGIYKDESVFGSSLEKLCIVDKSDVPRFVLECIAAIESKKENLKTDGIYRASGNLSQVQKIRLQVDQNNCTCLYQEEDVHVLAGSLKLFFRELKEPLIPPELFAKALLACHLSKKDKVSKLKEIISLLPKPNKSTLQALLSHLLRVAALHEFNRMQIPNLAIVFGPTLMYAAESQNMATDLMQQNLVIEALLNEYDSIFQ